MSDNQEVAVPAVPEEKPVLSGDPVEKTPEQIQDDWKAGLSDDLRADKSLENIKDISSLAKSYIHAQRLVGADKIPVPNKHATDEDWKEVYKRLGAPEKPDQYKYKFDEGQEVDTEALKNFSSQAHKLGLLPTQAQGMVNYYNEMVGKQLADAESISTSQREKAMTELKTEWGQAYDQKLQKANTVVSSVFPKGIMSINLEDGTKLGDHSEVIKAFAALGEKMGEDDIIKSDGPVYMTPKQIEKQIGELQQTGSAYWDKNHPNHDTAVQEVQTLIQKKNNEEVV
jgi:hypothetical protein